jgi:transposase
MIQLRCDLRARRIYDNARQVRHSRREAMRFLKRHLSDVAYPTMLRDATRPGRMTRPQLHQARRHESPVRW